MVMVDEAHSTGVIGKNGAGCVEYFGCTGRKLVQMGTLSKALGSLGGYITGSRALIDFCVIAHTVGLILQPFLQGM